MEHFRDITSFHSIGRVIDGRPKSLNDVVDYLNFLSQIIFCDTVSVSVLGPKEITDGTLDVVNKLIAMGVPPEFVSKYSYPEQSERILQRNRISNNLMHEWHVCFPMLESAKKEEFPKGYFEMLSGTVDIFKDVFIEGKPVSNYKSEIISSLDDDEYSYMIGLMFSNENLVNIIRKNFKERNIQDEHLYDFISKSRNKYNLLLSEDLKLAFTPTAARMLKNTETAHTLIDSYKEKMKVDPKQEMESLKVTGKQYEISIPSAIHMLLSQNSTSARALMDKALKTREALGWYRKEVLSDYNTLRFSGNPEDEIKLSNLLNASYRDITSILSANQGISKSSVFGYFSVDLSSFSSMTGSGKMLVSFLQWVRSKAIFSRNKESYLLTQELIYYMSKSEHEYQVAIQKLYVDLGGDFGDLILGN
ncbi:hypothetical protein [Ferrimonas aestuarii]|uniref:Uncharacterized protein n=1 Tax=Ferrimonas aestuarii TaxID=2569539 RepID=A0A4U1BTI2_9GAMM|nr:hypothetical protein [Ferrimonas aestuarii]TKB58489.1 hypothetical protein FCL42_01715 [Ferrimonas aestuarii]